MQDLAWKGHQAVGVGDERQGRKAQGHTSERGPLEDGAQRYLLQVLVVQNLPAREGVSPT